MWVIFNYNRDLDIIEFEGDMNLFLKSLYYKELELINDIITHINLIIHAQIQEPIIYYTSFYLAISPDNKI